MTVIYCSMTTIEIDFVDWLNGELIKKDWNPAMLAKKGGLDSGVLSRILNRERNPGTSSLTSIAEALGYPPEFVFRMAGILPPEKEKDPSDEELLYLFQKLTDQEKEIIRAQVRALVERNK